MTSMHHFRKKNTSCVAILPRFLPKNITSLCCTSFLEGLDLDLLKKTRKELNDKRAAEEERKQLVPWRKRPKKNTWMEVEING